MWFRQSCCFFFKQKTAYELRISDWSSDVCSSDLLIAQLRASAALRAGLVLALGLWPPLFGLLPHLWKDVPMAALLVLASAGLLHDMRRPALSTRISVWQIGRAHV